MRTKTKRARQIDTKTYTAVWNLHQTLGRLAEKLNRPLEQAELMEEKPKSVPIDLLDMLF